MTADPGVWIAALDRGLAFGPAEPARRAQALRLVRAGPEPPAAASSPAAEVLLAGELHAAGEATPRAGGATGDAGRLLAAYEARGPEFLSALRGHFALVLWDPARRRLLCARDPMGVHPLFYAETEASFLVSPAAESLLALGEVPRDLDRRHLAAYLASLLLDPRETAFAAVRRALPGHVLEHGPHGSSQRRYWEPPAGGENGQDPLERFDELLETAVARCTGGDLAAVYLSGGVDSATVATVARARARREGRPGPLALSVVFPTPDSSELGVQRRVARSLGVPQRLLPAGWHPRGRGTLAACLDLTRALPHPPLPPWRPAYHRLAERAREAGCETILTGHGGDEWLFPHALYPADRLRALDLAEVYRFWRARSRWLPGSPREALLGIVWDDGLRPLAAAAAGRAAGKLVPHAYARRRVRRTAEGLPAWLGLEPEARSALLAGAIEATPPPAPRTLYAHARRSDLDAPDTSALMETSFVAGTQLGVRILHPLLDPDLVAFLLRAPPGFLVRGGIPKWPAQEAIERREPVLRGPWPQARYADSAFHALVAREGRAVLRSVGPLACLSDTLGLVDERRFSELAEAGIARGSGPALEELWTILSLEVWLRSRTIP